MVTETIKHCIDKFNDSAFYFNNIQKFPLSRFAFLVSLMSVFKYEKAFYKEQGAYTRNLSNCVLENLSNSIRNVTLLKKNGHIDCWDINPFDSDKYIIFFSGIGSEKSNHLLQKAYLKFLEKGWGVIAFDYSGRGKSSGDFCQKIALEDAKCVYKYLLSKQIHSYNIGVLGHSLGAGVALDFASKGNLSFLLLLNPFNKASDMVKNIAEKLFVPQFVKDTIKNLPDFCLPLKNRFNNERNLRKVEVPTLILHNKNDEIIPIRLSRRLYFKNADKKNITFFEIGGNDHEVSQDKIDICLHFIEQTHIWFFNK